MTYVTSTQVQIQVQDYGHILPHSNADPSFITYFHPYFMCECLAYMCACAPYICLVFMVVTKGALGTLELELQMVVSYDVNVRN